MDESKCCKTWCRGRCSRGRGRATILHAFAAAWGLQEPGEGDTCCVSARGAPRAADGPCWLPSSCLWGSLQAGQAKGAVLQPEMCWKWHCHGCRLGWEEEADDPMSLE